MISNIYSSYVGLLRSPNRTALTALVPQDSFSSEAGSLSFRNSNPLLAIASGTLVDLPTPLNLSFFWNFGSLLGIFLGVQFVTGLFLASHYCPAMGEAFSSVLHIMRDANYGWLLRLLHANGASFFFMCLYGHLGRNLYYGSFFYKETWNIGVVILFLSMGIAFLGYVLPWGQMSFWGATVITNFLSAIPYVGNFLVQWLWGGFAVSAPTLSRFFILHFFIPFALAALVFLHIFFLHRTGSHNPLSVPTSLNPIPFHSYFAFKDIFVFFLFFALLSEVIMVYPFVLGDSENFILANPIVTPEHIVPEWYFLFAYAVLRAIPNKLLGVIFLVVSVAILFLAPLTVSGAARDRWNTSATTFRPSRQILFFLFLGIFGLLTWVGGQVVEDPFISLGQIFVAGYFLSFGLFLLA